MSLNKAVLRLKPHQVQEIHAIMVEGCIAAALGEDYQEIFRRAKQRKVGSMRKMLERMQNATPKQLERMADHLVEGK